MGEERLESWNSRRAKCRRHEKGARAATVQRKVNLSEVSWGAAAIIPESCWPRDDPQVIVNEQFTELYKDVIRPPFVFWTWQRACSRIEYRQRVRTTIVRIARGDGAHARM